MGYMRHHTIVVTASEPHISAAHEAAKRLRCEPSEITPKTVNGYQSFMVPPDGSKEGWCESDAGDEHRSRFIEYLRSTRYSDGSNPIKWVCVQFGDDNKQTCIVDHSDQV